MNRDQLEHAIRAVCDVLGSDSVVVVGSQAVLGQFPSAPPMLLQSIEVDVIPYHPPMDPAAIDAALGEMSQFHRTYGFYVQGLEISSAFLPAGWAERAVDVRNANTRGHTGRCLEVTDLAASKLYAFRDKDREFVRVLLAEKLIDAAHLVERMRAIDGDEERIERCGAWITATAMQLDQ